MQSRSQRTRSFAPNHSASALPVTSRRPIRTHNAICGRVVNGRPLTPSAHWRALLPSFSTDKDQLSVSLHSIRTVKKSPPRNFIRLHFRTLGSAYRGLTESTDFTQMRGVVGTQSCAFKRERRKVSLKPCTSRKERHRERRKPSELEGWGDVEENRD